MTDALLVTKVTLAFDGQIINRKTIQMSVY
jgi:hypothetical protein